MLLDKPIGRPAVPGNILPVRFDTPGTAPNDDNLAKSLLVGGKPEIV